MACKQLLFPGEGYKTMQRCQAFSYSKQYTIAHTEHDPLFHLYG